MSRAFSVAKITLIAITACCIAFVGLVMLGLWARAATEPVSIDYAGVCVDASSRHSMEASANRIIVYDKDGAVMQIATGEEAALSEAELMAANNADGAIVAAPGKPREFVAAQAGSVMRIELYQTASDEGDRLLAGVRFCGIDTQ